MTDIAALQIKADSRQVRTATRDLQNLQSAGDIAAAVTGGIKGAFLGLVGPISAATAVLGTFGKLISTQREFDILNAGLVTATGSIEGATEAFSALQDFASSTPYSLQQVTEAFTKLQNYGLNPSERALTSYGNTSAALGKDLMQMVEAVADAATGEFERLKEFGIKAKKNGDEVKLTFRGVTTTVKNNAQEIENYLIKLGENNFAGNMEARMKTLDGAISNLGDEIDKFFLNVSQSGIGEAIADGVRTAIDVLSELNDYVASGEFEAHIEAMGAVFEPWAQDIQQATEFVAGLISDLISDIDSENPELSDALMSVWTEFPENVRAIVQLVVTAFYHSMEQLEIRAKRTKEIFAAIFNDDTISAALERGAKALEEDQKQLKEDTNAILNNRNATIAASKAKMADAAAARAQYEANKKNKPKGDRLAGFQRPVPKPDADGVGDKAEKAAERAAEAAARRRKQEYDSLIEDLRTEEEKIAASYERRKLIIEENTVEGTELRSSLMAKLDADLAKEEKSLKESQDRRIEQAKQGLMTEEEDLSVHLARRKQMIIDNITDPAERDALIRKLEQQNALEMQYLIQGKAEQRDALLHDNETRTALERANTDTRIAELQDARNRELITEEEFIKARNDLYKYGADGMQKIAGQMDQMRQSFESNFTDLITGAKSGKQAFIDFADSIIAQIARIIAQNASMAIFGAPGSTGGGAFGGIFESIFGMMFGGGRAGGGSVQPNMVYEVGEGNKPEIYQSGNRSYMIPGNKGKIIPNSQVGGSVSPINVNVNVLPGASKESADQAARRMTVALRRVQRNNS